MLFSVPVSLPPAPRSSQGAEQRSNWQEDDGGGGDPLAVLPGREVRPSSTAWTRGSPTGRDEAGKGTAA